MLLALAVGASLPAPAASLLVPAKGLRAADIAVVVNEADPLSVAIGDYYREARGVPERNLVRLRFEPGRPVMPAEKFARIEPDLRAATPGTVQAYALTWAAPYRVGCMSITTAFAAGYDEAYCAQGCALTRPSDYFDSGSSRPWDDHGIRPAMAIAAETLEQAKALIDRGVAADAAWPQGSAYLLDTSDSARNVRARTWPRVVREAGAALPVRIVGQDVLRGREDVMFYFTGLRAVAAIETNRFLPGAVADHLTSTGGRLTDSWQMSVLRWLEGGATGSYGTVVEPCNLLPKFPDVAVLLRHYLSGESLIEAYWKSVRMPGQGIFVGEPLARPFGGLRIEPGKGGAVALQGYELGGHAWEVRAAASTVGPYVLVDRLGPLPLGRSSLTGITADADYLWLRPVGASDARLRIIHR